MRLACLKCHAASLAKEWLNVAVAPPRPASHLCLLDLLESGDGTGPRDLGAMLGLDIRWFQDMTILT